MTEEKQGLEHLSDEDLAQRCMQRPVDEAAWELFYDRFKGFVRSPVRKKLNWSSTETEDVVQEIFTRIFRSLPSYDSSKSSLRTYISRVISSSVIDYWRHGAQLRSRTVALDDDIEMLQIRAVQDPEILRAAAELIVSRLRDKTRIELMRDLLNGKDVKDICTERGLTEYQVYTARKWLRNTVREIASAFPSY